MDEGLRKHQDRRWELRVSRQALRVFLNDLLGRRWRGLGFDSGSFLARLNRRVVVRVFLNDLLGRRWRGLGFDSGSFLARLNRRVALCAFLNRRVAPCAFLDRRVVLRVFLNQRRRSGVVAYALAGASRKSRGPPMGWVISHVLAGARLVLFLRSQTPTVTESSRGSLRTGKKQL